MNNSIWHYYKQFRRHQRDTYSRDNIWINGKRVHTHSGGGADAGFHAVAAYNSARSQAHFVKCLGDDLKQHRERSAAAKQGWKTRRSTQHA